MHSQFTPPAPRPGHGHGWQVSPVMFLTSPALREYRRHRRTRRNRQLTAGLLLALIIAIALATHSAPPARHRAPAPAVCTTAPAVSGTQRPAGSRGGHRETGHPAGPRHAQDTRRQACGLLPTRKDQR